MAPILANADVQERLLPYLPSGESLPQTAEEIQNTLTSPQFQQALGMFSAALASGQLGPLMCQFGLPAEAVEAANKGGEYPPSGWRRRRWAASPTCSLGLARPGALGLCPLWAAVPDWGPERSPRAFHCVLDVEAFAKAMQSSASPEQQEGDSKDKKDEEEDMSLD